MHFHASLRALIVILLLSVLFLLVMPKEKEAQLMEPFTLKQGESAHIGTLTVAVEFLGHHEVQEMRGGQPVIKRVQFARVRLTEANESEKREIDLAGDNTSATFRAYTIFLQDMEGFESATFKVGLVPSVASHEAPLDFGESALLTVGGSNEWVQGIIIKLEEIKSKILYTPDGNTEHGAVAVFRVQKGDERMEVSIESTPPRSAEVFGYTLSITKFEEESVTIRLTK